MSQLNDTLDKLKECGGSIRKFLRLNVPRAERGKFIQDFLEALESDEVAKARFAKIRKFYKLSAKLDAEDNLTSLLKSGKAQNMKAIHLAIGDKALADMEAEKDNDAIDDALEEFDKD